jgi:hypothetical protein
VGNAYIKDVLRRGCFANFIVTIVNCRVFLDLGEEACGTLGGLMHLGQSGGFILKSLQVVQLILVFFPEGLHRSLHQAQLSGGVERGLAARRGRDG